MIAAIERCGGVITTAYFDPQSLEALCDTVKFFHRGVPIPRRMLPPENIIEYYSDPQFRGYLANPTEVSRARVELSQKFGHILPDLSAHPLQDMLTKRKDPRQVFYDLEPGWVVNLRDQVVLMPKDEVLQEYYRS